MLKPPREDWLIALNRNKMIKHVHLISCQDSIINQELADINRIGALYAISITANDTES